MLAPMRRPGRSCALLLVVLAGCAAHSAPGSSPKARGAGSVSEASARAHLEFLASDALNGRGGFGATFRP
jgi:hypothetical protein